jgi:hypothetical protein
MLEHLFLDYANYSLRDDPENLLEVFNEILGCQEVKTWSRIVEGIVKDIIRYARLNDPKKADEQRKKDKKENPPSPWLKDIAFEAVYKYRKGCSERCSNYSHIDYGELLRRSGLSDKERLKCYECSQLIYIDYLSRFARGGRMKDMMEYKGIETADDEAKFPRYKIGEYVKVDSDFEKRYLRPAYRCAQREAYITYKGKLSRYDFLGITDLVEDRGNAVRETQFADYLDGLVGYSLTEFLLKNDERKIRNDERKIRRCTYCNRFFARRRAKNKVWREERAFCSDRHRDLFHRDKRKRDKYHTEHMRKYRELQKRKAM